MRLQALFQVSVPIVSQVEAKVPDLESIQERAMLETSPFFASLSQESRLLLLDLLTSYTDLWRWNKPDETDADTIEALVAAASLGLMVGAPGGSGDMGFIARLEGIAGAYVFEDIPQDYRHLQAWWRLRTNFANNYDLVMFLINGDTTASYANARSRVLATAAVSASVDFGDNEANVNFGAVGANAYSGYWSYARLNFYNYLETNQHAWDFAFTQPRAPSNSNVSMHQGGGWHAAGAPITELEFQPVSGTEFVAGSYIDLYGIKG